MTFSTVNASDHSTAVTGDDQKTCLKEWFVVANANQHFVLCLAHVMNVPLLALGCEVVNSGCV